MLLSQSDEQMDYTDKRNNIPNGTGYVSHEGL